VSEETEDFKVAVLALDQGCILADDPHALAFGGCEGEVQAHHVITQQQLRGRGLEELTWDPQNGAAVCYRHHRRHHNRAEPIPVAALPERCRRFAYDHDLQWFLDRYYRSREDGADVRS
jgi:hypothetical protein